MTRVISLCDFATNWLSKIKTKNYHRKLRHFEKSIEIFATLIFMTSKSSSQIKIFYDFFVTKFVENHRVLCSRGKFENILDYRHGIEKIEKKKKNVEKKMRVNHWRGRWILAERKSPLEKTIWINEFLWRENSHWKRRSIRIYEQGWK